MRTMKLILAAALAVLLFPMPLPLTAEEVSLNDRIAALPDSMLETEDVEKDYLEALSIKKAYEALSREEQAGITNYAKVTELLKPNSNTLNVEQVKQGVVENLEGKTIGYLGSSVTRGRESNEVSFPEYIAKMSGSTSIKQAIDGSTLAPPPIYLSFMGITSYVNQLKNGALTNVEHLDALVIQLSTNDARFNLSLGTLSSSFKKEDMNCDTTMGAMEYLIAYAKEKWNCPVLYYVNSYHPQFQYNPAYENMIDALYEIQGKWGIDVVDMWNDPEIINVNTDLRSYFMYDSIHPYKSGYYFWYVPKIMNQLAETVGRPQSFPYIDAQGNDMEEITDCILINESTVRMTDQGTNGWYVVYDSVENSNRINVKGNVNLLLCDGAELDLAGGINVETGSSLTIWQQKGSNTGRLVINGVSNGFAGIGSGSSANCGTVIINGGSIAVQGGADAAGIGGGNGRNGGTVRINSGIVTAAGGENAAGIGGGNGGNGGTAAITGGKVTAYSMSDNGIGIGDSSTYTGSTKASITLDWTEASKEDMEVKAGTYNGNIRLAKPFRVLESAKVLPASDNPTVSDMNNRTLLPCYAPVFVGQQLILGSQIGVHFLMLIPEGFDPAKMNFTVGSRSASAAGVRQSDGIYKFTCYINSIEMAETITAEYTYTYQNESRTAAVQTSVQGYLETIINNVNHIEEYTKATALAKAIYNYGYYAMLAVPGGSDHPMMPDTYATEINLNPEVSGHDIRGNLDFDKIRTASYSLVLDSETEIRFYFETNGIELTADNVSVTAPAGTDFSYTVEPIASYDCVRITGIAAHELGSRFEVEISEIGTISASALSYVQNIFSGASVTEATKNAAAALYNYYVEAIAYRK